MAEIPVKELRRAVDVIKDAIENNKIRPEFAFHALFAGARAVAEELKISKKEYINILNAVWPDN